ncbi:TPA: hypothetical protein HA225_00735 [Candidatus Micrarchaeota archaeon]|nr:hypothetical protein [Candidatus Micrarchaeota archaeon]HIH30314.1 hypothetical protein [Candidatus Micrarchaeota archaeon]
MSFVWSSGKKSATSLDHFSYYMIVGMEYQMHDRIVASRRLNFPPLAEGINANRRGTD